MQSEASKKLTTAELAEKLRRSTQTIKRWRRLRTGPPFVRVQGIPLYDEAKVDAWLDAQPQQQAAQ